MVFSTSSFNGANAVTNEAMRITAQGKLLIGTTSDTGSKLQVNGTATFSSSVTATSHVTAGGAATQLVKGDGGLTVGYKVYTASLLQSGTNAPVATVLENTLGGTVVWTRNAAGQYQGTLNNVFTANKTVFFTSLNGASGNSAANLYVLRETANIVSVKTLVGVNFIDGHLNPATIEIRVYN